MRRGEVVEVAAVLAIYEWLTFYLEQDKNQAYDEEAPPISLDIHLLTQV